MGISVKVVMITFFYILWVDVVEEIGCIITAINVSKIYKKHMSTESEMCPAAFKRHKKCTFLSEEEECKKKHDVSFYL